MKKESYRKFEADKFSLLEEVKQVNIGNARSATLSIGLGLNTATYALSYNYARMAIDLALARGGDQAVIKDCKGITYFGGKKEQTAKNTRVKAVLKQRHSESSLWQRIRLLSWDIRFQIRTPLERVWEFTELLLLWKRRHIS